MAEDRPRPLLSKEQHEDHFSRVIAPAILGASAERVTPVAILLHGQPGIGKSTYAETLQAEVVGGGKVRPLHPRFAELRSGDERQLKDLDKAVDDDTKEWTAMLVDHARDQGLDLAIDSNLAGQKRLNDFVGQLHHPEAAAARAEDARRPAPQPHRIEVHSVAGPAAASELRALNRFYDESVQTGEKAPYCMQEIQDKNFAATLESARAVDESTEISRAEIRSWWNQSEVLHEQNFADGRWSEGAGFADAVDATRNAPFANDQQQWFLQTAEKLAAGLGENFHGESYHAELHRACTDARALFPSEGPARDRLETVIAAVDPSVTPRGRGALRDALKARSLTETNNVRQPGATAGATNGQQARPAAKIQSVVQGHTRGV